MVCGNIFTAPPRLNGCRWCFQIFKEILNPAGHPNCITGSKITAILLNGWISQQACFYSLGRFTFSAFLNDDVLNI